MNEAQKKLAIDNFKSPFYVFDVDSLTERICAISSILGDKIGLCYAIKANPFIIGDISPFINRLEVCSPGEFFICANKDISPGRIFLSGVCKTAEDISDALEYGVINLTAESMNQMRLINDIAARLHKKVNVFLRVSSGNQFGIDKKDLLTIVQERGSYPFCSIVGVHYFAGTQRKLEKQQVKDIDFLITLFDEIEKLGFEIRELEYGPGLYYPYFKGEDEPSFSQLTFIKDQLSRLSQKVKITLEMGRYFVAACGAYFSRVVDVKRNEGQNYVLLDGGINHFNYYGGNMGLRVPSFDHLPSLSTQENLNEQKQEYCICGSLCTTADVLIRSIELTEVNIGDYFIFNNVGAYSSTESIGLFLSRKLPAIIKLQKDNFEIIRSEFETYKLNQ